MFQRAAGSPSGAYLRASYVCAALALGLLALHFNAGLMPGWTRALAVLAAALALAGAGSAALYLARRGWSELRNWPGQAAFALNAVLALGFLFYANP